MEMITIWWSAEIEQRPSLWRLLFACRLPASLLILPRSLRSTASNPVRLDGRCTHVRMYMYVHNSVGRFSMARSFWASVYRPCIVVSPESKLPPGGVEGWDRCSGCWLRVRINPLLPEGEAPSLASPSSPSNGISRGLAGVLSR